MPTRSRCCGLADMQALTISYIDGFKPMMIITLCAIPLAYGNPALRQPQVGRPLTWTDRSGAADGA